MGLTCLLKNMKVRGPLPQQSLTLGYKEMITGLSDNCQGVVSQPRTTIGSHDMSLQ